MIEKAKQLLQEWKTILDCENVPPIKEEYKKMVTAQCLENEKQYLKETTVANATGSGVAEWNPILIGMVRRAMPNLLAFDICGVQPMTGPTGLIFALRSRYTSQSGQEALYNEPNTAFSGDTNSVHVGTDPSVLVPSSSSSQYLTGTSAPTARFEDTAPTIAKMAFSIEKVTVTAGTRMLAGEYTQELQQDLKAIHGLDASQELANILSNEILAEINREVIRTVYESAMPGQRKGAAFAGQFDLNVDTDGRWSAEKYKGMLFAIEKDANDIAKTTRRGRGNMIIVDSDTAAALSLSGALSFAPALSTNLDVDDTGNLLAGTLNGKIKVYVDPYFVSNSYNFWCVGYKGASAYDAGIFYAPYRPLESVSVIDPTSYQPKMAFKTRYGIVSNPFAAMNSSTTQALFLQNNMYYRLVQVRNLGA